VIAKPYDSEPAAPPLVRRHHAHQQGVALVVVMGALVLISFLVLTILTLNLGEQRASTHAAELTDVRTLAELPGQIVISQIRNATQGMGQGLTWTSQPGLIRVFDTSAVPTADPAAPEAPVPPRNQRLYPLYSTRTLYADETFDVAAEVASLSNWPAATALFTDLNEPVERRRDLFTGEPLPLTQRGTLLYPILDPAGLERQPGAATGRISGMAELTPGPGKTNRQPVPMPVRWLYVLNNGKVLAPLPSSGPTIARFNQRDLQPEPGEAPPQIIGRIAFWTDDESCKVNLNTATEPAPWLPPMTVSERDRTRANSPPVRGEFHRLAGHPSFTALSPVLRGFGVNFISPHLQPFPQPPSNALGDATAYTDFIDNVHSLLPGLPPRDTGSVHGTETVETFTLPPLIRRTTPPFSNLEDLLFDTGVVSGQGIVRLRNGHRNVAAYPMDESDIRRARFCLTTHSSAPETNPFNLPKISLWPVQQNPANRTRTDQLMVLASTLGGISSAPAYYGLQRASEWVSPASPGSSQETSGDLASGSRNEQLFDWLRTQTTLPFAGYGASFLDKYGEQNRDQIILNMFDMLRWLANPGNDWVEVGPRYRYLGKSPNSSTGVEGAGMVSPLVRAPYRGVGRVPTVTEAAIVFIATNAKRNSNGDVQVETSQPGQQPGRFAGYAARTTEVRAFLVLEPFNASPGHPSLTPSVKYVLKGLNGPDPLGADPPPVGFEYTMNAHTLNGQPLNFGGTFPGPYALINHPTFSPSFTPINASGTMVRRFGGDSLAFTGLTAQFVLNDGTPRLALGLNDPATEFPWFSRRVPIPEDHDLAQPLPYVAGDVLLEIRHATTDELLQEIVLPFGEIQPRLPIPRLHPDDFDLVGENSADEVLLRRFRLKPNPANPDAAPYLPLIRKGDVVRSVDVNPDAPHGGDLRVIANHTRVPRHWFAPERIDPVVNDETFEIHTLREGVYDLNGAGQIGGSTDLASEAPREPRLAAGSLLNNGPPLALPPMGAPLDAVPPSVRGALVSAEYDPTITPPPNSLRFGDWETGQGNLPDGPYFARQDLINAPSQALSRGSGGSSIAGHFTDGGQLAEDPTGLSHTPQRQISSAVVFGALSPTLHGRGPSASSTSPPPPEGWRTLLFCPNPASRITPATTPPTELDHPGFANPPDSLWLDFFWMPTVEPRLMSAAFATEGKINLNFQMIPFTWLERSTGIHAALQGVQIPAIPHNAAGLYKQPMVGGIPSADPPEFLYEVNVEETLRAMRGLFTRGEVFTHPSDICAYYLVPKRISGRESDYLRGLTPPPLDPAVLKLEQLNEWWNGADPSDPLALDAFELTGDNLRESPYAQLYPRLCTRSNVFKVHYRVQLLGKSRATAINEWDLQRESIKAEQRGAMVIERFLDPNDPTIPDLATATASGVALDEYYRYRIISREPFRP
jgi:uncharacterized protein (TIGR02600 family)